MGRPPRRFRPRTAWRVVAVAVVAAAGAFLAGGWPSPAMGAELYSWVDADGVLHVVNVSRRDPIREYRGTDAEGFGGQPPLVVVMDDGTERTVYPVDVDRYDELFRRAAEHYRLPFAFLKAVAKVESNFNPRARSKADAKGLMQLIDETAKRMNVQDPFDAEQSVFGGARYLRILANQFRGDMGLTAAAYNAGPERVTRAGGVPRIAETMQYVERVRAMVHYYQRATEP